MSANLFSTLDAISGVSPSDGGFHASFDHYYDNLSARQCHAGKPLPCKVNATGPCVTQDLANAVYRMGQWEYSQTYRDSPNSLAASVSSYGVWVAELAAHLRDVVAGKTKTLYFHNVAHDGSISRVLSILQFDEMVWPGMGSEIVFELYEKKDVRPPPPGPPAPAHHPRRLESKSKFYVRVLFGGKVLKSSSPTLGVMDMVPVETLLAYLDALVGENASKVQAKCN